MTIFEVCSIVLNAVVAVLVVWESIWLKQIMDQQIRAKDSTIETLEAVIKAKESDIVRLQSDTAPAVAEAYAKMRSHADRMSADVAERNRTLDMYKKVLPINRVLIESGTLDIVMCKMQELTGPTMPPKMPLGQAFGETFKFLMDQLELRKTEFKELTRGQPEQ